MSFGLDFHRNVSVLTFFVGGAVPVLDLDAAQIHISAVERRQRS